jgi:GNAT superfamily N-acetyltransferase
MLQIRRATLNDAAGIAQVKLRTWRSAYAGLIPQHVLDRMDHADELERWQRNLRRQQGVTFVAVSVGQVLGYGMAGPARGDYPPCDAELFALYVLHTQQRQGIGKKLVTACADYLLHQGHNALLIWVLTQNAPGRAFYEALGGQAIYTQSFSLGGVSLQEAGYVWPDLHLLASR